MLLLSLHADTVFLLLLSAKSSSTSLCSVLATLMVYTANFMGITFPCSLNFTLYMSHVKLFIYPRIIDLSHPMFLYLGLVIYKQHITVYNTEITILKYILM